MARPLGRIVWSSAARTGAAAVWVGLCLLGAPDAACAVTPLGSEFQIDTYTTLNQRRSSVASDTNGNFVVVRDSYRSNGSDHSNESIQAQRYGSSGVAQGGQFQVNSYTTGVQYLASVASDSNGGFVVAWQSYGSADSDTSGFSVQGQRYMPEPAFVPSFGAVLALLGALSAKAGSRG
ncbi:MAG TPA: hypothetical protein VMW19_15290 [Myxococcota bacterium]|nr:hypothetical protein [Myxococcota bacterium]